MKVQFFLKSTYGYERIGIMTLMACLKAKGHEINLLIAEDFSIDEITNKVASFEPQILAYSVMTGEHSACLEINRALKNVMNVFSIFGGPHPTFSPAMINSEGVDACVKGEGDIVFPELVNRMEMGKDFYDLSNFSFNIDGKIIENEIGPLVEDLNSLPFPERELLYEASPVLSRNYRKAFMTTRGCPYLCTYCFNAEYNDMTRNKGDVIRSRSVDSIIAEIKKTRQQYPLELVHIEEDTFLAKPKQWIEEFTEKYPAEIGLPFSCNVRPSLLLEKQAENLKKAGCENVYLGVECGNNEVALSLLKRHVSNEKIEKTCRILNQYGLNIHSRNILGLPVEDPLKVDLETLDFNIKIKPYFAGSNLLNPFPGTAIGNFAVEQGFFGGDHDQLSASFVSTTHLKFDDPMEKRKIENLHKLFGLISQFPALRPFTDFLIRLPFTRLYTGLYWLFTAYKSWWKPLSWKGRFSNIFGKFFFLIKYVSNLDKA